jgi:hypothetical protein
MEKIIINNWDKYWNLTILKDLWSKISGGKKRRVVLCKCDCWNTKEVLLELIRSWNTKSCWCLHNMWNNTKHKLCYSPLYSRYNNIKKRCNDKSSVRYKDYWWRWIKCEWNSFEEFYKDMSEGYKKWLQIDRIDNNWNYSKVNCRWTTNKENQRNKRNNILYKWKCLAYWCELFNLDYYYIKSRIRSWWSIENSLNIPKWHKRN